uniref:Uncharacterized protein n=1 Tax=Anopheles maculatus TaxID=74869 RepID=A0A182T9Q0_9DIPT
MLAGVVLLCALCLLLPITGYAVPTQPVPSLLASPLVPAPSQPKDTSDLGQNGLQRTKRNLDIGGILKTIGVGVDVGGPQLSFNTPNVTLDTPIGTIGCLGGNSRSRRDDGSGRRGEAESLETSEERKGIAINVSI